jgi:hypothetical protein
MTDIVKRLRAIDHLSVEDCFLQSPLFGNAADEIERLRAALRNVLSYVPHGDMPVTIYDNARAALAEEKPNG